MFVSNRRLAGDTVARLGMRDRFFVGRTEKYIVIATIAVTDFGAIGRAKFIPEFRTFESEFDGTVSHSETSFHFAIQ